MFVEDRLVSFTSYHAKLLDCRGKTSKPREFVWVHSWN